MKFKITKNSRSGNHTSLAMGRPTVERILLLLILLLTTGKIHSQDEGLVQFSSAARFDFIGLKNYEKRNFGLVHGEADVSASVLTEDLGLFKGGEVFGQVMAIFGHKASGNYSHDLQVFSNIESDSRIMLYQAYFKQTLGKFIIKIGQLDMNSDYSVSGYGASLLNSSFGVIPTISMNMPVPIFSYLSAGISFKYMISKRMTLQTAFYDGDPGNFETNRRNLNWHFCREEGFFNISEIHFRTSNSLKQGVYKAGFFYHSSINADPSDLSDKKGNPGFFIMGDQVLINEKNTIKNGLSVFFQASFSPSDHNLIGKYYSMGFIYRGLFRSMNEDECTLAFASAHINSDFMLDNPDYLSSETALEFTYKKYLSPNIIIQPDIQYIINTGANTASMGNTSIGILRAMFIF